MGRLALTGRAPLRDRPFQQWPHFDEAEIRAVERVMRSGKWWRYDGNEVADFEEELAAVHGTKYAVAVTSGTAALEASLGAMGIGPADEVIVPGYTFVATATAVAILGATPVFAQCLNKELHHENAERVCREILWLPQNALLGDGADDIIRAFGKILEDIEELRKFQNA